MLVQSISMIANSNYDDKYLPIIVENNLFFILYAFPRRGPPSDMSVVRYRPRRVLSDTCIWFSDIYSHGREKARGDRYVPRIRVKS